MKRTLLLATACTALWITAPPTLLRADEAKPAASANPQLDALQGKWEGVEIGHENDGKCTLTIQGNTVKFQGWNQGEWYEGTFQLPPNVSPLQLEATIKDCPAPQMVGKSACAIYKIENGTLTLSGNRPGLPEVPKTFEASGEVRTFTFKKAS